MPFPPSHSHPAGATVATLRQDKSALETLENTSNLMSSYNSLLVQRFKLRFAVLVAFCISLPSLAGVLFENLSCDGGGLLRDQRIECASGLHPAITAASVAAFCALYLAFAWYVVSLAKRIRAGKLRIFESEDIRKLVTMRTESMRRLRSSSILSTNSQISSRLTSFKYSPSSPKAAAAVQPVDELLRDQNDVWDNEVSADIGGSAVAKALVAALSSVSPFIDQRTVDTYGPFYLGFRESFEGFLAVRVLQPCLITIALAVLAGQPTLQAAAGLAISAIYLAYILSAKPFTAVPAVLWGRFELTDRMSALETAVAAAS